MKDLDCGLVTNSGKRLPRVGRCGLIIGRVIGSHRPGKKFTKVRANEQFLFLFFVQVGRRHFLPRDGRRHFLPRDTDNLKVSPPTECGSHVWPVLER